MQRKTVSGILLTLLLIGILPLTFSAQLVKAVDWWPMFRLDPNHTAHSTSAAPNTNNTLWKFEIGVFGTHSSPAVVDGRVYVGSSDHKVYCLNASTGSFIWSYTTGHNVYSSPAVAEGKVFVGSNDGDIYALNATTGAKIWNYTTDNGIWSSPAIVNGRVFVGSLDHKVYALSSTTGEFIWSYTTGGGVYRSSPAIAYGIVFVGSWDGKVYALNETTGAFIWHYAADGAIMSSPAVADGKVFIGCEGPGNFYALNATTGTKIWSYPVWVSASPAVADGKVFIGGHEGDAFDPSNYRVYAFNASTGAIAWNHTTYRTVELASSAAVADGKVFLGVHRKMCALDSSTGELLWSYTTGDYILSSPAVANGKVFVGSTDGYVYAFGPKLIDPSIIASIDVDPATLNLKSNGKWITMYIELPGGYNVSEIDVSTIMLNNTIPIDLEGPTEIGDYDDDGILDMMAKFDRQEVMAILGIGEATLTITGKVNDTLFEGSDTVRIIGG